MRQFKPRFPFSLSSFLSVSPPFYGERVHLYFFGLTQTVKTYPKLKIYFFLYPKQAPFVSLRNQQQQQAQPQQQSAKVFQRAGTTGNITEGIVHTFSIFFFFSLWGRPPDGQNESW